MTPTTTRLSVGIDGEANGGSINPVVSDNGRYVAFESDASNLVEGDTNERDDVFVRDLATGEIVRVSVSSSGAQAETTGSNLQVWSPDISTDGRYVIFGSLASNLTPGDTKDSENLFLHDVATGQTERLPGGYSFNDAIAGDGRSVAFASELPLTSGDRGYDIDIFVYDVATGEVERITKGLRGSEPNDEAWGVDISATGRWVAFSSDASNLVRGPDEARSDVFVHDRKTGRTKKASVSSTGATGNRNAYSPSISSNGRFVSFQSGSFNLVESTEKDNVRDIFVHDLKTGLTERVTNGFDGSEPDGSSLFNHLSPGGRFVLFISEATDLVPNDTNGEDDAFLFDRRTDRMSRVNVSTDGVEANDHSNEGRSVARGGCFVLFDSVADNLVPDDRNESRDIFMRSGLREGC